MKLFYMLLLTSMTCLAQVGGVGIGTNNPQNKLDVNGWVKLGDENSNGNDIEGSMRYNSDEKCVQFHDGIDWNCINRKPRVIRHELKDGIDGTRGAWGGIENIDSGYDGGGYGDSYYFVVNDVKKGERVLFLIELVLGLDLRKNTSYQNYLKITGNGTNIDKEVPGLGTAQLYTTFLWSSPSLSTGNHTYTFEINQNIADLKITSIVY